jgi:hypothetical protein
MSRKTHQHTTVRHDSVATHREQALCLIALQSHEYDAMTDEEWVSLCEKIARELPEAPFKGKGTESF